jgi:hypothetical protein
LAERSVRLLAAREERLDIGVASSILAAGVGAFHSINHPGNQLLVEAARQVCATVGSGLVIAPDRELLSGLHSPVEGAVIEALGLVAEPEPYWLVHGRRYSIEEVARAHLAFYGERPDVLAAGLRQHAQRLRDQGLSSASLD